MTSSDSRSSMSQQLAEKSQQLVETFVGDWESDRVSILKHMLGKTKDKKDFTYYTSIMSNLVKNINKVLDLDHINTEKQRAKALQTGQTDIEIRSPIFDNANVTLRNLFVDPNIKKPWWQQDYPDLKEHRNYLQPFVSLVTSGKVVEKMFGNQGWMTPYQELLLAHLHDCIL